MDCFSLFYFSYSHAQIRCHSVKKERRQVSCWWIEVSARRKEVFMLNFCVKINGENAKERSTHQWRNERKWMKRAVWWTFAKVKVINLAATRERVHCMCENVTRTPTSNPDSNARQMSCDHINFCGESLLANGTWCPFCCCSYLASGFYQSGAVSCLKLSRHPASRRLLKMENYFQPLSSSLLQRWEILTIFLAALKTEIYYHSTDLPTAAASETYFLFSQNALDEIENEHACSALDEDRP